MSRPKFHLSDNTIIGDDWIGFFTTYPDAIDDVVSVENPPKDWINKVRPSSPTSPGDYIEYTETEWKQWIKNRRSTWPAIRGLRLGIYYGFAIPDDLLLPSKDPDV